MHDFHNDALCDSSMLKQIKLIQEDNTALVIEYNVFAFHEILFP